MRRNAGRLFAGATFAFLLLAAIPQAGAAPGAAAIVTAVPHDVQCQRSGYGPFLPLLLHAPLYPGDVVRSGPDGSAELLFLGDGSSVKIAPNTTIRVPSGGQTPHKDTLLQVILGVIWAHLRPGTSIETPGQANTVTHNTEIVLSVTADGATTLTVVEGDATFSNPQGARELTTAQQSVARPGQAPSAPVAVDPSGLIAWTFDVAALPLEFEQPAAPGPPAPALNALLRQGQARRDVGDLPGALDAYNQALRLDGGSTEARVGLALTLLSQGQPEQARAALEPARSQPTALAALGLADLHQGRDADAERDLRAALALDPYLYTANALLALASLSRDDLPDALTASRLAVAERPDSAQAQGTRAMVLFFAGQTSEAEAASRRAVRLNPLSPFALLTEGRALLARQQTDAARTAFEKAASIAPYLWLAHQELGAVYLRLDMLKKADEEYRAALALDPDSADSHTGLGLSLQSRGRYAEAEGEHRRALALDPDSATAHYNLAALLLDRGRLDEARRELESGVRAAPERGVLYARLAEISLYRQDLFGAQEFARRAVSLLPDSALAHYELGRVYLEQERTLQAEQEFREATLLDRQFAAARYALGLTEEKTESGLLSFFSSIPSTALVGSPGGAQRLNDLQTPGAEERVQAALLDPTVVRTASRSYGDTQVDASLGERNTRRLAASFLGETANARGVRGLSGEEQRTAGIRANADEKLDNVSLVLGQKAIGNSSGFVVLGDYQETESGLDAGVTPDSSFSPFRFHAQQPRLLAGVNIQSGEKSRLRALLQGSTSEYNDHDLTQSNSYEHTHVRSFDGELRWDAQLGASHLFSAGLSYGTRRAQSDAVIPPDGFSPTPYQSSIVIERQPFQAYIRDEFRASARLSLTGQMQVFSVNTLSYGQPPVQFDLPTDRESHRTTLGLPTLLLDYQADPRSVVRLRARRLAASVQDFQLLTPRDVFLLSFAGLPETSIFFPVADGTSVEVEYDHTFTNAHFLSVAAFQQDLRQADFTAASVGPYPQARVQGVQANYQGLIGRDVSFALSAEFNHAQDLNAHQRIPQVPDYRGLASLQYLNRQGFYVQAAYYYQGDRVVEDADPTRLGGFGLLNLRAGKRLGLRINAFAELDNAFNRQYDVFGTLQPGRQVSAGVSIRF